jgi:superfamily II DNA or RNA helicase
MGDNHVIRNHQFNAIMEYANYFYNNDIIYDRGILSMACGSGKTYVFYNIVKLCVNLKLEGKVEQHGEYKLFPIKKITIDDLFDHKIFIFVTSRIKLIRDTIRNVVKWSINDNFKLKILFKVSDINYKSIKKDLEVGSSITNINIYKKFVDKHIINLNLYKKNVGDMSKIINKYKNETIIIITTYDSFKTILDDIKFYNESSDDLINIDLLTLDEAHHVASDKKTKSIKDVLEIEENFSLKPNKSLFLTATPLKIIKRNKKSNYTNEEIEYSMDNENIYGKIFYEYKFSEAIKDKVIVDFDVIYLNDLNYDIIDDYTDKLAKQAKLKKKSKEYNTTEKDLLSIQSTYFEAIGVFLNNSVTTYNLHHLLVYVNNIDKLEILFDKLKKYNNLNVNRYYSEKPGNDPLNIDNFISANEPNMTNVLLSVDSMNEGIDIPICDSILFAEERFSEVIIVQNIGRALRNYPGKTKAHILIPTKLYSTNIFETKNSYSSKYQTTRLVIDTLKNDKTAQFYSRLTNTTIVGNTNEIPKDDQKQSDDTSNSTKLNPPLLDITKTTVDLNIIEKINKMSIICVDGRSSNIRLDEIINNLKIMNIDNMDKLGSLLKNPGNIIIKRIIDDYIKERIVNHENLWKCYSVLLSGDILPFDECIISIHSLKLSTIHNNDLYKRFFNDKLDKISSVEDWYSFFDNLIEYRLNDSSDKNINDMIDILIKIPYRPRSHYNSEWIFNEMTWEDYLNIKIVDNSTDANNLPTRSINNKAYINIENIINNDKKIVKINNDNNEWVSLPYRKDEYLRSIKNYLLNRFGFKFIIGEIRFQLPKPKHDRNKVAVSIDCCIEESKTPAVRILGAKKIKYDPFINEKHINLVGYPFDLKSKDVKSEHIPEQVDLFDYIDEIQNDIDKFLKYTN